MNLNTQTSISIQTFEIERFHVVLSFFIGATNPKRKQPWSYLVCFAVFYVYVMDVMKYTLFPIHIGIFSDSVWPSINTVPFRMESIQYLLSGQSLVQICWCGSGILYFPAVLSCSGSYD